MDHWLWQREDYAKAWITILLSVNHASTKVLIKDHLYTVGPGQSVRSKSSWAILFGKNWTRDRVRTFFGLLQDDGIITQQSDNRTTILTVCNWGTYQNQSPAEPQQNPQQSHSRATAEPQQSHTNNNDNNGNNDKQHNKTASPFDDDGDDDQVVIDGTSRTPPASFTDWRMAVGKRCFVRNNEHEWNKLWDMTACDNADGEYRANEAWELWSSIYDRLEKQAEGKPVFVNQFIETIDFDFARA